MKVALIQLKATRDKSRNIEKAAWFVLQAAKGKAEFILLPEAFVCRGQISKKELCEDVAEHLDGPTVKFFKNRAKQYKVNILLGSIFEKIEKSAKAYNTSVLIDKGGQVKAAYRKNNLFVASLGGQSIRETDMYKKGVKSATAVISNMSIGFSICYDLRFSDLYRRYAKQRVDILTAPSNFTKITGKAHWEILLKARAVENLAYVLAPNQVGKDEKGITSYGNSMVISPWGEVLAKGSLAKEEIVYAQIHRQEVINARRKLPGII